MGVDVYPQYANVYSNQSEFDRFFATAFDRYDRNRDGRLDHSEFQPLINDMCQMIQQKYGTGPTLDKIRQAWMALDRDGSGYITRAEFSSRARAEVERILKQSNYRPQGGYAQPGYGQPAYPPQGAYPPPAYPPQQPYAPPPVQPVQPIISLVPPGGYPTIETYGRDIGQEILDTDCRALRAAMKGIGTDEAAIIHILTSRSNAHRYMLKHRYKALLGRDLVKDLKSELSGHFEDVCIAMLESPYELDCRSMYEAMARLGTNEATLIEIVATRPTHQLYQDKILFKQLYGKDLVSYVESETSGHFRKVLVAMLQCQRHENTYPINQQELRMEAQRLYSAGAGRWGTDESVFTQIFATRSPLEIAAIAGFYKQICGYDLYTTLKKEFSGNVEKLLKAIFYASINPPEWFATRVRNALEGIGTKDKQLIRIIVSRAEIDLREIKQAYFRLYNRDMVSDIRNDTKGDYKRILTEICNKC